MFYRMWFLAQQNYVVSPYINSVKKKVNKITIVLKNRKFGYIEWFLFLLWNIYILVKYRSFEFEASWSSSFEKNHLGGQILYRRSDSSTKTAFYHIFRKFCIKFKFFPEEIFSFFSQKVSICKVSTERYEAPLSFDARFFS